MDIWYVLYALYVLAQVQCFDAAGTKLEFTILETFGFLPVPDMLKEGAISEVEVRTNGNYGSYGGTVRVITCD